MAKTFIALAFSVLAFNCQLALGSNKLLYNVTTLAALTVALGTTALTVISSQSLVFVPSNKNKRTMPAVVVTVGSIVTSAILVPVEAPVMTVTYVPVVPSLLELATLTCAIPTLGVTANAGLDAIIFSYL